MSIDNHEHEVERLCDAHDHDDRYITISIFKWVVGGLGLGLLSLVPLYIGLNAHFFGEIDTLSHETAYYEQTTKDTNSNTKALNKLQTEYYVAKIDDLKSQQEMRLTINNLTITVKQISNEIRDNRLEFRDFIKTQPGVK